MEPFRSVRGGGARAWLAAAEASLLRSLVSQIMALVDPQEPGGSAVIVDPDPVGQAGPRDAAEDAELAALEAMVHGPGSESPPEDPVLSARDRTNPKRSDIPRGRRPYWPMRT